MKHDQDKSVDDEMLMALADGELDSQQAEVLRSRIAQDPELAVRYAIFVETAELARTALSAPEMPDRLIQAALTAPSDMDAPEVKATSNVVPLFPKVTVPLALAASLVVGLGLGWGIFDRGAIPAAAPGLSSIAQAAQQTATGGTLDLEDYGAVRVIGSFDTDQGLCRLLAAEPAGDNATRFLACKDGEAWTIPMSVAEAPSDAFTPASEAAAEMIDLYLDAIGAGPALEPEEEAEALK